jgi:polyisoprenoid-binding protein YceI
MSHFTRYLSLLLFMSGALISHALETTYPLSKEYKVTIHGTSNLHDWDENVELVSGYAIVNWYKDGSFGLNAMNIKMEVRSIKSENSTMNKNTYKALKADTYPQITFVLSAPPGVITPNASGIMMTARGNLTIAGVTKPVDMRIKVSSAEGGKLTFEGSYKIKMTDFGVKPPTAILGTLKTGNEITINFKVSS